MVCVCVCVCSIMGGVQYSGEHDDKCWDIMSTHGGVQCHGGYHGACGGTS